MDKPLVKVTPQDEGTSTIEVTVPIAAPEGAKPGALPTAAHLTQAIHTLVNDLAARVPKPEAPRKPERPGLLPFVTRAVGIAAFASALAVWFLSPSGAWRVPGAWLQIAVFVAVASVPHWLVEGFAWLAVALGKDLEVGDHKIGFTNPGAYLGVVERVLFLGALVAGYPEFIAVWFVFKGIADYRVGLPEVRARRTFQLFLLNNAVSLAGVGLGWLVWNLLGLPTH